MKKFWAELPVGLIEGGANLVPHNRPDYRPHLTLVWLQEPDYSRQTAVRPVIQAGCTLWRARVSDEMDRRRLQGYRLEGVVVGEAFFGEQQNTLAAIIHFPHWVHTIWDDCFGEVAARYRTNPLWTWNPHISYPSNTTPATLAPGSRVNFHYPVFREKDSAVYQPTEE